MTLKEAMKSTKPVSQAPRRQVKRRWDQMAKPLGSLGVLEENIIRIAAASGSLAVSLHPRAIVVTCGDNGIVKEGVTQTGQEATVIMTGNMAQGSSCVCLMARQVGADIIPVDVGMACRDAAPGVVNRKVTYGTKDFLEAPTMIGEETVKAMEVGADTAVELKERGYVPAGSGEMGIDNTTTSNALLSVLSDMDPEQVTGRRTGLTTVGYNRKAQVIRERIRIHRPSGEDPVDALFKVGGLDLAALTGFYIGYAACGLLVVLGRLITGAAALAVVRISPDVKEYLLASHVSAESAGAMVLDALDFKPAISTGMHLGEGTGAVVLPPLLDTAAPVYTRISSFDETHVDVYEHLVQLGLIGCHEDRRSRMTTLVTGGSGSGKPEYAEGLILGSSCSRRFYATTMIAYGKKGRDKVEHHCMFRQGKGFITIGKPRDAERVMSEEREAGSGASSRVDRALLLECIPNLAVNEMFKEEETGGAETGEQQSSSIQCLSHKIVEDIIPLAGQVRDMVVVTNEVDRDGICYGSETMEYIRLVGCLNQKLASTTDRVAEAVHDIPVFWKPISGQAAVRADLTRRECQGE